MLGLWSDRRGGASGAACREGAPELLVISLPCPERRFPSVGITHPPALRLERTIRDLYGLEPEGSPDARRWLDHGRWGVRPPLGAREAAPASGDAYAFLTAVGPPLHQIPGRPRARRHHRARPLPLQLQRRGRGAPGRAARLRAQGDGRPDARRPAGQGGEARRPRIGRQHRRLRRRLRPRRRGGARPRAAAARDLSARADGRAGTPRQPPRRHRRHLQRRLLLAHARPLRHPARARAARRRRLLRPPPDDGPRGAGRHRRRPCSGRARRRCRRSSARSAAASPSWSSSTTAPPRCRTAPSPRAS